MNDTVKRVKVGSCEVAFVPPATRKSEKECSNISGHALETIQHTVDWTDRTEWHWPKSESGLNQSFGDSCLSISKILKHVPERRVCVQAGGGCGIFPKRLAREFEFVYTFEPNLELFECLTHNCQERNVYKFPAALSDRHEMIDVISPGGKYDSNRGAWYTIEGGTTPTMMLDDFEFEHLDLIYLDIEGDEHLAMSGALHQVEYHRPTVVVECKPKIMKRALCEGWMEEFMRKCRYKVVDKIQHDYILQYADD